MVLTDVWKKFSQRAPVAIMQEAPPIPGELRRGHKAALAFLPILKKKLLAPDGTLHAGTMLCAAAWLTGTSLYRSLNFNEDLPPGTIIKSDDLNREWERLVYLLEQYNFQKADIPVGRLVLSAMGAPDFFKPKLEMLHIQQELQEQYNTVMKKHGFDYLDGARVGVILCSILLQQYSAAKIIELDAAAGVAAQGIFEAARCVPPPLE
ncbi:MAG TPA: hypothetical protein VJ821_14535 [Anaerolineales bacterium]|nr:hypothetical protein [Anaerolineales bacterium]